MTQILVTLNEDATTVHVRKAIEMLRGVVSTTVFKTKDESNKKTLRQQAYVKESLKRAFDEMKQANYRVQTISLRNWKQKNPYES